MLTMAIQCSASLQTYWQVDEHFASEKINYISPYYSAYVIV